MIEQFSLNRLLHLIIYSAAVGIFVRLDAMAWRHFWNIQSGTWGLGLLVASCVGLFIFVTGAGLSIRWAWIFAAVIIIGSFLVKLLENYFGSGP